MTDGTGQGGAAPTGANSSPGGDGAAGGGSGNPWHAPEFADLVTTKKWASPNDALKSYSELEKFRGAPADRLLILPDKPDAPEWGAIRAKVGWAAPEKPEDYGIKPADGVDPAYANHMAATAHKLGIPKDALLGLVAESDKFAQTSTAAQLEQQQGLLKARISAADKAQETQLGARHKEVSEGMLREAKALGLEADSLTKFEAALALEDEKFLPIFRNLLAENARMKAEPAFHDQFRSGGGDAAKQAQATLESKMGDQAWVVKATTRGTAEAAERIMLNTIASGATMTPETAKALAAGTLGM